jgi:hypothetical protein
MWGNLKNDTDLINARQGSEGDCLTYSHKPAVTISDYSCTQHRIIVLPTLYLILPYNSVYQKPSTLPLIYLRISTFLICKLPVFLSSMAINFPVRKRSFLQPNRLNFEPN